LLQNVYFFFLFGVVSWQHYRNLQCAEEIGNNKKNEIRIEFCSVGNLKSVRVPPKKKKQKPVAKFVTT
jgi:hypothetical protein